MSSRLPVVERYLVRRELGRGGMGVVYEAFDHLTGRAVALKRVQFSRTARSTWASEIGETTPGSTTAGGSALALAEEFATLAALRHPHIVGVQDYGFDVDGAPFYTMQLLRDATTIDLWAAEHPETLPVLLAQLLEALRYLHRNGVLHRDLKPQNALVTMGRRGPRLALVDFGLAVPRARAQGARAAGTPAYIAPEVVQLSQPTVASDLYSFGVLAWDLLAGRHPYAAISSPDTLAAARQPAWRREPPQAAPEAVRELLVEIVALHPTSRPEDADSVLQRWRAGYQLGALPARAAIAQSFVRAAAFTARERELEVLTQALGEALQGQGGAWLIEADSGAGKSRLVDEVVTRARVRGMTVLIGQASDSRLVPFDVWRDVVPGLALVSSMTEFDADVLSALSPNLAAVHERVARPPPELSAAAALERLLAAIERAFDAIHPPAVVVLEDLHWARPESLALLDRLTQGMRERPCLVLATSRASVPACPELRRLPLGPLSRGEVAQLGEAVLGPGRAPVLGLRDVVRLCKGNAFWALEALRRGVVSADGLEELAAVQTPEELLVERVEALDPDDVRRVELAAVAGRHVDPALHEALGGAPEAWLGRLVEAAVLEVRRGRWTFANGAVRQAVLSRLSPSRIRALHARVGDGLEVTGAEPAELAYHLAQAGQVGRALPVQLEAAESALALGAAAEAEAFALLVLEAGDAVGLTQLQWARAERCAVEASYAAGALPIALQRVETLVHRVMPGGARGWTRPLGRVWALLRLVAPRVVVRGTEAEWRAVLSVSEVGFEAAQWAGRRDLAFDLLLLGYAGARAFRMRGKLAAYHAGTALVLGLTPLRGFARTVLGWATVALDNGPVSEREATLYWAGRALVDLQCGALEESAASFERVLGLSELLGDRLHEALALRHLWILATLLEDPGRAHELNGRLQSMAHRDRNPRVQLSATFTAGFSALPDGPLAARRLERGLELAMHSREQPTEIALRGGLSWALWQSGRHAEAVEMALQNLEALEGPLRGVGGYIGHRAGLRTVHAAWVHAGRPSQGPARSNMTRAIAVAARLGRVFPISQPMAPWLVAELASPGPGAVQNGVDGRADD